VASTFATGARSGLAAVSGVFATVVMLLAARHIATRGCSQQGADGTDLALGAAEARSLRGAASCYALTADAGLASVRPSIGMYVRSSGPT
jgi:hypothetical protein